MAALSALRSPETLELFSRREVSGGTETQVFKNALQNINIAKFGVTDMLQHHWQDFRRLFGAFEKVARRVLRAGGLVNIEWPNGCAYWGDRRVSKFLKWGAPYKAVIAACMHGMRPLRPCAADEFIGKRWRVSTSDAGVASRLDRRCDGAHRHVHARP